MAHMPVRCAGGRGPALGRAPGREHRRHGSGGARRPLRCSACASPTRRISASFATARPGIAHAAALELEIGGAGVYRIEARIDGRLWLLSNPVHLR